MTLLVSSFHVRSAEDMVKTSAQAWNRGADAVELRIDDLPLSPAELTAFLQSQGDRRWIVTCRSAEEGGTTRATPELRFNMLAGILRSTDAFIDVEVAEWTRTPEHRRLLLDALQSRTRSGPRLILSVHSQSGPIAEAVAALRSVWNEPFVAAGKIAYHPGTICDTFEALDLLQDVAPRCIAIAMGESGLWTRVLARKLGAFATFCALDTGRETATGQVPLRDMLALYRWPTLNADTQVFGVCGEPVRHSMGPLLFNHWFQQSGFNAVYLPLPVSCRPGIFQLFITRLLARSWLHVGGLSVTLPHKRTALACLAERADRLAQTLGAVNTLVLRDGQASGHNTDCHAALDSLAAALGIDKGLLADVRCDVLGTGGASRAVVTGLRQYGSEVTIFGRTPAQAEQMASSLGASARPWDDRLHRTGDVLINCTNVGLWPDRSDSPMPREALRGCRLVFDLIYNPLQTHLLFLARQEGIATLNGLDMFIRQAAAQFELWTRQRPDLESGREVVREALRESADSAS